MPDAPRRRQVLVLDHFAVPHGEPGPTRHAELFGQLRHWDSTIIASNRNRFTRSKQRADDELFRPVWVTPYGGNNAARVLNWTSYSVTALAAGLRSRPVDLVYASSPQLLAGLTGWVLAQAKRVPFVLEIRDLWPKVLVEMGQLDPSSRVHSGLKALERFLYRRAEAVVVLAEGSRTEVVADGAAPDRVVFLPNGADPEDFRVHESRGALRQAYGMKGVVFLYAGAHGPANGLDLVLDAAEALAATAPDIRFWLVGDGVCKPSLIGDASRRGLSNVIFRDPVPKREIPKLLAAADFGLHVLADVPLFRHAVSPNKLFDYMAAGRPVLTNTPGEVARLVSEADAGLAVAPGRIAEGAREMAASSAARRAAWSESGRSYVGRYRCRRVLAQQLEELLDGIVGASP
jgi:glycosyltransferase involved in cell wall biosynthesis